MRWDDYYQLLGVSRYVSQDAVKRAFRTRVLAVHPDCHPQTPMAAEKTRKLIQAYKVLADPARRRQYDSSLVPHVQPAVIAGYHTTSFYSQSTSRTLMVVCAVALVACMALLVGRGILADQPRIYRPFLDTVDLSAVEGSRGDVFYSYCSSEIEPYLAAGCRPSDTPEWPILNRAEADAYTHLWLDVPADVHWDRTEAPLEFAIP